MQIRRKPLELYGKRIVLHATHQFDCFVLFWLSQFKVFRDYRYLLLWLLWFSLWFVNYRIRMSFENEKKYACEANQFYFLYPTIIQHVWFFNPRCGFGGLVWTTCGWDRLNIRGQSQFEQFDKKYLWKFSKSSNFSSSWRK